MFFKNFFFNGFLFLSKKTAQIVTSAQKKTAQIVTPPSAFLRPVLYSPLQDVDVLLRPFSLGPQ